MKALVGEIVLSPAERENNFSSWGERGTAVEDAVQCSGGGEPAVRELGNFCFRNVGR